MNNILQAITKQDFNRGFKISGCLFLSTLINI